MDTATILTLAREKISDTANWRKGSRRSGQPNQYCSEEAIEAVTGETGPDRDSAIQVLSQIVGDKYPYCWNDDPSRTHAEVLAAFDRAIAAATERP